MEFSLRPLRVGDWESVRAIFEEGIASGNATFETASPSWAEWDACHLDHPRLVATARQQAVGWAALSPVSGRCVYSGVAEVSVYVRSWARGQGVGTGLLRALARQAEAAGLWTLQTGIFPENLASISLHRSCGFREVGRRERIGQLRGVWRDVILMERRSLVVGIEP